MNDADRRKLWRSYHAQCRLVHDESVTMANNRNSPMGKAIGRH